MSLLRDYDVTWPNSTIQLLSYSDSLNLGISITAPQCFVPGYNFFVFYIATMAQPVSCTLWALTASDRQRCKHLCCNIPASSSLYAMSCHTRRNLCRQISEADISLVMCGRVIGPYLKPLWEHHHPGGSTKCCLCRPWLCCCAGLCTC